MDDNGRTMVKVDLKQFLEDFYSNSCIGV